MAASIPTKTFIERYRAIDLSHITQDDLEEVEALKQEYGGTPDGRKIEELEARIFQSFESPIEALSLLVLDAFKMVKSKPTGLELVALKMRCEAIFEKYRFFPILKNLEKLKKFYKRELIPFLHHIIALEISSSPQKFIDIFKRYSNEELTEEKIQYILETSDIIRNFELNQFEDLDSDDNLEKIYKNFLRPLEDKIKNHIRRLPIKTWLFDVAQKGKASYAGLGAIPNILKGGAHLKPLSDRHPTVFIRKFQNVVYYRKAPGRSEEERLAQEFFSQASSQAALRDFSIRRLAPQNFGIPLSDQNSALRGYSYKDLSENSLKKCIRRLSVEDQYYLKRTWDQPPIPVCFLQGMYNLKQLTPLTMDEVYKRAKRSRWVASFIEGTEVINFDEICQLIHEFKHQELFNDLSPLTPDNPSPVDLANAINYDWMMHRNQILFTPDLAKKKDKKAYEESEKAAWKYQTKRGVRQILFKEAQSLYIRLGPEIFSRLAAVSKKNPLRKDVQDQLEIALEVPLKIVRPQVTTDSATVLDNITTKPYVEIFCLRDLYPKMEAVRKILSSLTPEAEYDIVLTALFQMYDLHDDNIGFVPIPNEEYEYYKSKKFHFNNSPHVYNFQELLIKYLNGDFSLSDKIGFEYGGQIIFNFLRQMPNLQRAFEVRWKFQFFDLEYCFQEENHLHQVREVKKDQMPKHLTIVPIRSGLLIYSWNQPFSEACLRRVLNPDIEERFIRFASFADAPVFHHFSENGKREVKAFVDGIIKDYSISELRFAYKGRTISFLRYVFMEKVSIITPQTKPLWELIERELSLVSVFPGATWEKMAKRYKQNEETLKQLNPDVDLSRKGAKVKIVYNVTGETQEIHNRRKRIAGQLFPRMTIKQRRAFEERLKNSTNFLRAYERFKALKEGDNFIAEMQRFCKESYCPLNFKEKREILALPLPSPFADEEQVALREVFLDSIKPNYFNLLKCMYPLLADSYEVTKMVASNFHFQAGDLVGFYRTPLNLVIDKAREIPQAPGNQDLINHLEDSIASRQSISFFTDSAT